MEEKRLREIRCIQYTGKRDFPHNMCVLPNKANVYSPLVLILLETHGVRIAIFNGKGP